MEAGIWEELIYLDHPCKSAIPPLQCFSTWILPLRTRQNQFGVMQSLQAMLETGHNARLPVLLPI